MGIIHQDPSLINLGSALKSIRFPGFGVHLVLDFIESRNLQPKWFPLPVSALLPIQYAVDMQYNRVGVWWSVLQSFCETSILARPEKQSKLCGAVNMTCRERAFKNGRWVRVLTLEELIERRPSVSNCFGASCQPVLFSNPLKLSQQ
jgi:hypothetical protein